MKRINILCTLLAAAVLVTACGGTAQGTAAQSTSSEGTAAQEMTSQDTTSQDTTSQDTTSQETTSQDTVSQDTVSQEAASDEPLDPTLVKSVTEYSADFETGEWVEYATTEYTYENAYPVKIDKYEYDLDAHSVKTFEYTFEDGLPVSMKQYDEFGVLESTTEYNKGRVYEINRSSSDQLFEERTLLQYSNDDAYFTTLLSASYQLDPDDPEKRSDMEEVDSIAVTTKDGLLKKTTNSGLYANWDQDEAKEWMRFNGTYTANYDSDGILNTTSAVYRAGGSGGQEIYEVTKDDGKITEVVYSVQYPDVEPAAMSKFTFEYEDAKIDNVRYAMMINDMIGMNSANCYRFYWY